MDNGYKMGREDRRAAFLESVQMELDYATKEMLDATSRLEWVEDETNLATLDRWIDATAAALAQLRQARVRRSRTELDWDMITLLAV
jgi:hypothetical protein